MKAGFEANLFTSLAETFDDYLIADLMSQAVIDSIWFNPAMRKVLAINLYLSPRLRRPRTRVKPLFLDWVDLKRIKDGVFEGIFVVTVF